MLDVATVIVYCGGYVFLVFLSVCLGKLFKRASAHLPPTSEKFAAKRGWR